MNGYLLSVFGTVLLSAILTAVLPEGKTSGVIKAVAKSVCLLAIVAPIPNYLLSGNFDEKNGNLQTIFPQTVIQTDEDFIKYYSEMRVRITELALEKELEDKFNVETSVKFDFEYAEDEIKIVSVHVKTKTEEREEDKAVMWEYLTKNYCSEVMIE
ncbi:MAG: hypothetical protein IJW60_05850 [Clostridia bacterium]|nr:hypothetical protein [Clostridia bacterium]